MFYRTVALMAPGFVIQLRLEGYVKDYHHRPCSRAPQKLTWSC